MKKIKKAKITQVDTSSQCPVCYSENIDSLDESNVGSEIEQYWTCGNCHSEWKRCFIFTQSVTTKAYK